ncbi:MAG: glycine cleavage system protein GcvH [Pelolinea sp.]|jgi:glycine cleavage system H protein|nr:glycine cleavage system protein GcvH [Pelolinea sp.]
MSTPKDLKFSETDEWIKVKGNSALIGITDFAQSQLSDIVYIEYELDVDDDFEKDETVATIESVKAAADIHAPVSGTILEINEALIDNPEHLNEDPYGSWLFKISIDDPSEVDALMDAETYDRFCEDRGN